MLILSRFVAADAAVMCEADRDPEMRRRFDFPDDFAGSLAHSEQVVARWDAERAAGTRFPFAVRNIDTNELVGGCELRPIAPDVANVSYWTYPPHRRRCVATQALALLCEVAFHEHKFSKLEALIDPDNIASQAVASANGFEESGTRDTRLLYVRRK
jgi:RimJ/RimL family protein N-acetyltransferase